jgi:peptide/nickel transport system substrate-binding protein
MLSGQINLEYGDVANQDAGPSAGLEHRRAGLRLGGLVITDHTGAKNKPLGSVEVRQALNYAFDGAAILKAVGNGAGVATNQVFPDGGPSTTRAEQDLRYDVAKAKELLTEAGYPNGFDISMPMSPCSSSGSPPPSRR